MHFYGLDDSGVMQLPMKLFWLMANNIDRIMARNDLRAIPMQQLSQATQEYTDSYRQQLTIEAGTIVKLDAKAQMDAFLDVPRDDTGFAELQMMAGQKLGN